MRPPAAEEPGFRCAAAKRGDAFVISKPTTTVYRDVKTASMQSTPTPLDSGMDRISFRHDAGRGEGGKVGGDPD
jgi:hypothetical protein